MDRIVVATIAFALTLVPLVARPTEGHPPPSAPAGKAASRLEIKVTEDGFVPREVKLRRGRPTALVFTRATENTCITAIDIPDEKVKELALPLNKPVTLTVTPQKKGVEKFHCSAMGMGDGRLIVEE